MYQWSCDKTVKSVQGGESERDCAFETSSITYVLFLMLSSYVKTPAFESTFFGAHFFAMLRVISRRFRRLCSRLRWPGRRRLKPKIVIKDFGKSQNGTTKHDSVINGSAVVHPKSEEKRLKVATFNASLFSMAPAVPKAVSFSSFGDENQGLVRTRKSIEGSLRTKSANDRPRGILKQSPLHPNSMNGEVNLTRQQKFAKSKLRVSINLPDNEISLLKNRQLSFVENENEGSSSNSNSTRNLKGKAPARSQSANFEGSSSNSNSTRNLKGKAPARSQSANFVRDRGNGVEEERYESSRTILEVLKELDADILALQDVKAEEEKAMKPLSDLADALGMNYVFAESWAPEYGNAILSKWPIKRWKVQKIFDDTDFRNILKATIDVPQIGEINFYCTHLDHLDETWRMKQIHAIIQSSDGPHILAGGLNSLDETDYSPERWTDIVKYYEEMGKPTPKAEVLRFLKSNHYTDAKDFAGECESVVMIAKGQDVQGTCKYGTRVDYILTSPNSPYKFIPGSYSVFSSKGTSDHHIVKVDLIVANHNDQEHVGRKRRQRKLKVVRITNSSRGVWKWKAEDEKDSFR